MAIRTVIVIKVFKENIFVIHFKLRMGAPLPTSSMNRRRRRRSEEDLDKKNLVFRAS